MENPLFPRIPLPLESEYKAKIGEKQARLIPPWIAFATSRRIPQGTLEKAAKAATSPACTSWEQRVAASPPELLRSQAGALGRRLELGPYDRGVHLRVIGGLGGEAAVPPGDHVLPAHQLGVAHQALGDELGVFDDVARVRDHSGDEYLARGELHRLPEVVLMLVPRVGGLKGVGAGIHFQHHLDDVLQ